jgi:hypothetical protein
MRLRTVIFGLIALVSTQLVSTQFAAAEPFTYQGVLQDGGVPANGLYNINLQITDAEVGGAIIGGGFAFANVQIVDGLFQLEFDPGDIFSSQDVWLEVTVEVVGGKDAPVTLTPNTKITAAPKAQYASVAETAMNAPWTVAPGVITYGDGNDRVFINRSSPITSSEFFGVHGNSSSFNGMYVSGPSPSSPFYGYSVGGDISAYHYYNSISDAWILFSNGGEAMRIDDQRDAQFTGDVTADAFRYPTPKTGVIAVSGNAFHSGSNDPFRASLGSGGAYQSQVGSGWLVAPIQLPQGASLTKMTAYVSDISGIGDISVRLQAQVHGGLTTATIFYVTSAGSSGVDLSLEDSTPTSSFSLVNNLNGHYHLRVFSDVWAGNNSLRISSVVIEYTINEAN